MLIAVIALVIGTALYVMNMVGVNINANVICSLGVLIVGFAMLIKGADLFVEGASKIAAKFKIPHSRRTALLTKIRPLGSVAFLFTTSCPCHNASISPVTIP